MSRKRLHFMPFCGGVKILRIRQCIAVFPDSARTEPDIIPVFSGFTDRQACKNGKKRISFTRYEKNGFYYRRFRRNGFGGLA